MTATGQKGPVESAGQAAPAAPVTGPVPAGNPRPNPYVGARPFRQGETLYGRSREQRRLLNQLIADRIILLNSPSGAGKTSLIQAALIPDLQAEHFLVLPVARVNTRIPDELAGRGGVNRYLLSLLLSLDESLHADRPTPLAELAATSLDDYLTAAEQANPDHNLVLIVDQFEEILTVDPTDDGGRQAFFDALSSALRNRRRWALFAMREEFVTRLDPLVRPVPTRLTSRFRLELLSPQGALEAIQKPPGPEVTFDDDAAAHLVDDLRTVKIQQDDGTLVDTPGNAVEPVQLQVVCQRLWNGLSADDTAIGLDDVLALGDVSKALEAYYDEQVRQIAGGRVDLERAIRDWIETQLITAQGIRSQIAREPEATRGLDNDVITELDDRRLVRSERRRGVDWFELAHDRLIRPVQASNAAWRATHLAGWQQRAILWDRQGRPVDLLLAGSKLAEAEQQAAGGGELAALDRAFLEASRERRRQRRQRTTLAVVGVLLAAAVVLAGWLVIRITSQNRIAEQVRKSSRLAALGESLQFNEPDLAALLEVQSAGINTSDNTRISLLDVLNGNPRLERMIRLVEPQPAPQAGDSGGHTLVAGPGLRATSVNAVATDAQGGHLAAAIGPNVYLIDGRGGQRIPGAPLETASRGDVTDLAFTPDGTLLAAADLQGTVTLWDLTRDPPARQSFQAASGIVNGIAFDPSGQNLAVIGKNNAAVWPLQGDMRSAQPAELLAGQDTLSVAWSSDGRLIATGDRNGQVSLVSTGGRAPVVPLAGPKGTVKAIAFSPDSRQVAAAIETSSRDFGRSTVLVWPVDGGQPAARFVSDTGTVTSLAFVEDGTALATGTRDNRIEVWDLASGLPEEPPLRGSRQAVFDVAYASGSQTLVSGDGEGRVFLWRFDTPNRLATPLLGHTDQVYTVAFSPDDSMLASGGLDGSVRLWNLTTGASSVLGNHSLLVNAVEFSPDGQMLASGGPDGIKLWQLAPEPTLMTELSGPDALDLSDLTYNNDGTLLATGNSKTGDIFLWDMTVSPPQPRKLASDYAGALSLTFAPDGDMLYAANEIGEVHGWNVASGEQSDVSFATGDGAPLLDVAISPDGQEVAAASSNSAINTWYRSSGSPYGSGVLAGHSLPVSGIAFDRDSYLLASAGHDGQMILWSFGAQQPLGVFRGHDGPINAVAISHDGRLAATAGDDHKVLLWQVTLDQWEAAACQLAARSFTGEEVDKYLEDGTAPTACRDQTGVDGP